MSLDIFPSKTAILTGASEGIGLATARLLVSAGWNVGLLSRNEAKMATALEGFASEDKERVLGVLGDVTVPDVRQRFVSESVARFGRIDALVNNAGGGSQNRFIEDVDDADLDAVVTLNLTSAFAMCRQVVPRMKAQKFGRIVNVASVAGRDSSRLSGPHYAAAKAGMVGLTRQLSRDLGPAGITVNTVAPGITLTDRIMAKWDDRSAEDQRKMREAIPVGRFGTPLEVAHAIHYFLGEDSGYTTGACLDVNGGSFCA